MPKRVSRVSRQRHKSTYITRAQLHVAWRLHIEGGVSQRELGRKLWQRLGYSSPKSCQNALSRMFRNKGWRTRDRIEATVLASTKHGLLRRYETSQDSRDLINERQRKRAADRSRQCEAITRSGRQCARRFRGEGMLCSLHTEEGRAEMGEQLREMRARRVA